MKQNDEQSTIGSDDKVTFAEKLERARTGSKAAYESLCLGSVDSLYTAALIALKSEAAAKNAVTTAISDGYAGVSRIKDERHLRSWLVHELTKNAVDKLREMKSSGSAGASAGGAFAEAGKLADVERLVFAVAVSFGYGAREISVLTGMSEDAVSEKLHSIKTKLGAGYEKMQKAAASYSAPESLKARYTGFDEAAAKPESNNVNAAPAPAPQPVREEMPEPEAAAAGEAEQEAPQEDAEDDLLSDTVQIEILNRDEDDEAVFEEESAADYGDADDADITVYDAEDSGSADEVYMEDREEDRMSDAAAFIAVVSAEKMKGSEFLHLIGNTRISNSVYREIEQNPRLTKKRLIELLEQSPLTESDYYKLLTAVKHRREVLNAKEESRRVHEMAGLYDGPREKRARRRREEPKTELQMAIEMNEPPRKSKPIPLTLDNEKLFSDNTDYEIQNAAGEYSRERTYEKVKDIEDQSGIGSLGDIVSDAARPEEDAYADPLGHAAMQDLFDERSNEAVDPFAAIAANETGVQAKPDRIDMHREEPTEPYFEEDITSGTREFDIGRGETGEEAPLSFDARDGEPGAAENAENSTSDPVSGEEEGYAVGSAAEPTPDVQPDSTVYDAAPSAAVHEDAPSGVDEEGHEEAGFSPMLDLNFDADEDDDGDTEVSGAAAAPVMPYEDDTEDEDGDFSEAPKRNRYKGNEFFYDDSKYYDGVNRGKIIFCAVCAVLLTAGAMGMKYMGAGSGENAGSPAVGQSENSTVSEAQTQTSTQFSEDASMSKLSSYDELFSDRYKNDEPATSDASGTAYLNADGKPYAPTVCEKKNGDNIIVTPDMMYIYTGQGIRAVKLDPTDARETGFAETDSTRYIGMAVNGGELYVISEDVCGDATQYAVRVDIYGDDLVKTGEYTLSGSCAGAGITGGKLVIATNFSPSTARSVHSSLTYGSTMRFDTEKPYYAKDGELHEISADSINVIEGTAYNGMTVIGIVGSDTAAAVAGGSTLHGYADIREDGVTVLRPDEGCTYAAELSASLGAFSVRRYAGTAFSADCIGNGGMICADAADGSTAAYKGGKLISSGAEGETPAAVSWSADGTAYVVAEKADGSAMLYGFDMSGEVPASAKISADDVSTHRLAKAGSLLAGLKPEVGADDERTGLRLSLYGFDGKLTEKAYAVIGLDERTDRENLRYLSSPAEKNCLCIASDESGTFFAVPTVYFDGFSEVERTVILQYDGTQLKEVGNKVTYSEKSDSMYLAIRDGVLITVTDSGVQTAELSSYIE